MKTIIITLISILLTLSSVAQQGINYKALIKDSAGNAIADQSITVQFAILQGSTNVYTETHTPTTNANGIIIINIGKGSVQSGDFAAIDWAGDEHFLHVQIDTGNGLVDVGTTQFMAVPYALNAANVSTKIDDLEDGKHDGSSLFLGENSGKNDDSSDNRNTGIGFNSLFSNTTGNSNSANGYEALFSNTTGSNNSANGAHALQKNTTGENNTTNGFRTLNSNTTGSFNTANGYRALNFNTTGNFNTANGSLALFVNKEGNRNSANGYLALYSNTIGSDNTANGNRALNSNTEGNWNTANGTDALLSNITGDQNTANGFQALRSNISGNRNTAIGTDALFANSSGALNVANGYLALSNSRTGNGNTAIGYSALSNVTTGSNNIGVGFNAQVPSGAGNYQVQIGDSGITYAGIQVAWTITSDKRWKDNIRQLPYGLNMVTRLEPVDYIRKNNSIKTREIGFIAQDVEQLLQDLGYVDQGFLTKDDNGYISLRYNDLIPILTKAIQEQQIIINNLQSKVNKQNDRMRAVADNNELQNKTLQQLAQRIERLESSNQ